jgi:hypothetical protein
VIACESAFYILKYNKEGVANFLASGGGIALEFGFSFLMCFKAKIVRDMKKHLIRCMRSVKSTFLTSHSYN